MGQYPITAGVFGKAMSATGIVGTPNGKPAWVFENQSGDLGNLLNSSTIWYDALQAPDASINVIPAGTSKGILSLGVNTDITILSGGTGYSPNTTLGTLTSNPRSGQGLTVQVIIGPGQSINGIRVITGGSGYSAGDIITVVEAGRPGGSLDGTFQLTKVDRGIPTADESIEFKVQGCGVLPIAVDYITGVNNITATELVICK
jgi:hypothetical protein